MDFSVLFIIGGILTYIGVVVYLANQVDLGYANSKVMTTAPAIDQERFRPDAKMMDTWLRWLHYGLVGMTFLMGFGVLQAAFLGTLSDEVPAVEAQIPEVSMIGSVATFLLVAVVSVFGFQMITNADFRFRVQNRLNRLGGAYNPESRVHNSAILLMLAASVITIVTFVVEGGVGGIAQSIQDNGIEINDVVFQAAVQVVITLLGVGFAIRRDGLQTLERLGLRAPTREDVTWGIGLGVGFWLIFLVVEGIWVSLTSPELLQEQTAAAEQMNLAFATLPLALILSASAAIGEEIWMRGGLQPVFGILVTSIFFTILHSQVAFTPAMVIIFGLSLGLGWLRQRQSTVAAIIAHFCFNFIQLALLSLVVQAV